MNKLKLELRAAKQSLDWPLFKGGASAGIVGFSVKQMDWAVVRVLREAILCAE